MNKLVSIIIPTYSRPTNLCRAIDSVLSQTYKPIEIIIVDDNGIGSDYQKETERILSKYIENEQIIYIKHDVNKNGSAARNTGVRAAHGFYVGLLDDDDEFLPNKVEEQVKCLEETCAKDESVCGCFCNGFLKGGNREYITYNHPTERLAEQILTEKVRFNSSTILMYRDIYIRLNGFDERYERHQDWEFFLRFLRNYKFVLACPDTYLTIKHSTPNIISRNPIKAIEYLAFFLDNFKEDIDGMSYQKDIYHHQYLNLAYLLLRSPNCKKMGLKYVYIANRYKCLTLYELGRCLYSLVILSFKNKVH